ncbi:DEAD/DEAH box helicase [Chloroflexota bacterium]
MSVNRLLSSWRAQPEVAINIEEWRIIPSRPASTSPLPSELHPHLKHGLHRFGIESLYSHQAQSWNHVHAGRNIVIVTGTASGKSLCYNLPILDRILRDENARALYLFPTKALAQDQAAFLSNLIETACLDGSPDNNTHKIQSKQITSSYLAVYDGDTPSGIRPSIRTKARLLLSNPDMLHVGILPHHTSWAHFFSHLQFIVIDEMHIYRGVFGSHFANVLRRLKRIAKYYGSYPQFILTSATIANPSELASKLIEEDCEVIDEDGSARGQQTFLIYNPPVVNKDLGLRRSALHESIRLVDDLLTYNIQTIIFGRSRRTVELILTYLHQKIKTSNQDQYAVNLRPDQIRAYRGGYLPLERREIESGLRDGRIRAVVATNALELGIDIGKMGASIMVGYPGTIASIMQQAGRAGRGKESSLAVLITTAAPIDQFLATHTDYLFKGSPEHALINPDNLLILLSQLRCAAFELPFNIGDEFGKVEPGRVQEFLQFLTEQGVLHKSGQKFFWMDDQYPTEKLSLRSASAANITLQAIEGGIPITIGHVDRVSAHWMVHPGAIYLHQSRTYIVDDLDLGNDIAHLRHFETDYYTEPQRESEVSLIDKYDQAQIAGGMKSLGEIKVTFRTIGFRKIKWFTHEQIGVGEVILPSIELQTTGYWLCLENDEVARLRETMLWRNDPNDYGPNWRIVRRQVRARDNFRCQVCGKPEKDRQHDVHHKIPFRAFPSFKSANKLENLTTLCQNCHQRAEMVVKVRSGLSGVAYVLGHLAPFFLMCDIRDLGVFSDPQSPLSEGQPTVVIYDQVPAGIGLSQRLFELHNEVSRRAYNLVGACECSDGCPSCVGPGGENGMGGKPEALAILKVLAQQ